MIARSPFERLLRDKHQKDYGALAKLSASVEVKHAALLTILDCAGDPNAYGGHGHFHEKVLICDKRVVLSGSFNSSEAARTANKANIKVSYDKKDVQQYAERFHKFHEQFKAAAH